MPTSTTPKKTPRIAVIGGGISGLTAAYRLTQLFPEVELDIWEASDRLGGVLHTRQQGELLAEYGADSFIDKLPAAVKLCRELGLGDEIIPTNAEPRRALILHDGKLQPVPAGFVQMRPEQVGPMMRTPLLSWQGKLRLLDEKKQPRQADIDQSDYDESVASFATRRLGREVFERLVQPLIAGIYTADPYKLSVAATMPTAIEAERQYGSLHAAVEAARAANQTTSSDSGARYASFVTLQGGLARLIQTLVDRLANANIHLGSRVKSVTPAPEGRWQVALNDKTQQAPYDGVIVALPAPRASELLVNADSELSTSLKSITYASSAVAILAYERQQISDPLDGFGVVVPTVEERQIVAASYSSVKFPGRAPADKVLIRVFVGGALQPELLDKSDEQILTLAHNELNEMLGIQGQPLQANLQRWNEKMPQYHVGHVQLVDCIESLVACHPGLELAGNAYRGVGIPQCVRSGDSAARRIVEKFSSL